MNPRIENVSNREHYSLIVCACGYEQRSRAMIEKLECSADRKIALSYPEHHGLSYPENVRYLENANFSIIEVADANFYKSVVEALTSSSDGELMSILIDISCFTRFRLAELIRALGDVDLIDVDFFYSLAEYEMPLFEDPQSEHVGPASEYFSGWSGEYAFPSAVICGVGYEFMKALGAIEHIDASDAWIFLPESPIAEYDEAVEKANDLLLRDIDDSKIIRYDVTDAPSIVRDLFSLVGALRRQHRCVLLPLGPKLFAFCSMFAGYYFRDVAVWRVSAGKHAEPRERKASPTFCLFRVTFAGSEDSTLS